MIFKELLKLESVEFDGLYKNQNLWTECIENRLNNYNIGLEKKPDNCEHQLKPFGPSWGLRGLLIVPPL